jgi:hypothetical protein
LSQPIASKGGFSSFSRSSAPAAMRASSAFSSSEPGRMAGVVVVVAT